MSTPMLELMLTAARAASTAIMEVYLSDFEHVSKADGSPVTVADQRAENIILEHLMSTDLPILAEESVAAGIVPRLGNRFFVVDPLDGTKEFLKRNGEFTVNIALCEGGRPTHGVVVAPATGATFVASPDGAYEITGRDEREKLRTSTDGPMKVVASRSHGHGALEGFCQTFQVVEDVSVGSSLKFCLVAKGEAQLYPRFTPTSEWDTAAGQAILEAAGGSVLCLDGTPLAYGKGGDNLNPFFIAAASPDLAQRGAAEMRRLLKPT
ncbi:MAG: 3'(2'),5'-bisphosphate nucleotidase [Devosia sp. 67-54]|uniref:3'(2'),5'-bisphosphate nucleotidase CysQ n=1 Tax=unclassified Devosia TaxID=196773 RepID=UPI00095A69A1|nr:MULTISPECIES: 3'(2'),5'-bisphosphate nucleotidase CysQ [unclassified Devosia]MBN9307597.1 3'(2'),5'-bisphosphate nucleotidase CysQ [Devosia sp.]OJX19978.1 MAG: 3'(2'),5'-bisphosphate nucleotidase [Devosia sp. 67-54]